VNWARGEGKKRMGGNMEMLHDIMTPFSLLQMRGSNLRPLPEGGLGDSGTTSMIL
jgi:hypothetical protein